MLKVRLKEGTILINTFQEQPQIILLRAIFALEGSDFEL